MTHIGDKHRHAVHVHDISSQRHITIPTCGFRGLDRWFRQMQVRPENVFRHQDVGLSHRAFWELVGSIRVFRLIFELKCPRALSLLSSRYPGRSTHFQIHNTQTMFRRVS
jgi:hypothetical protein